MDGAGVELEGEWSESSSLRPFVGTSYWHDGNGGKGTRTAKFPFVAEKSGLHEVKVSFVPSGNRAGKVMYEVSDENGLNKLEVDQRKGGKKDNIWYSLGSFVYKEGKEYRVSVYNKDTEGYVIVDAMQVIALAP